MKNRYLFYLIAMLIIALILDSLITAKLGIYLTIILIAFVLTRFEPTEAITLSVFTGIIMDAIFSAYIGPISIILLLAALLSLILRTYYKINKFILYYIIITAIYIPLFLRAHWPGFTEKLLMTYLTGAIIFYALTNTFKQVEQT